MIKEPENIPALKPCPFCGEKIQIHKDGRINELSGYYVARIICGSHKDPRSCLIPSCLGSISICLGKADTKKEADAAVIEKWNTRTNPTT